MMGWTKRQFIEQAYEEIGFASYTYDLEPERLEKAMYKLDAMMAILNIKGVRIGYPLPSSPQNAELDQETDVPDFANEPIYTNLAIRIAGSVGKTISPELRAVARAGYRTLLSQTSQVLEKRLPRETLLGAGNKTSYPRRVFISPESEKVAVGRDGELDI